MKHAGQLLVQEQSLEVLTAIKDFLHGSALGASGQMGMDASFTRAKDSEHSADSALVMKTGWATNKLFPMSSSLVSAYWNKVEKFTKIR